VGQGRKGGVGLVPKPLLFTNALLDLRGIGGSEEERTNNLARRSSDESGRVIEASYNEGVARGPGDGSKNSDLGVE